MTTAIRQMAAFRNQILAGLPRERYSSLFSNLTLVTLNADSMLYSVEDDIRCAYFIDTGLASLMSIGSQGNKIEVCNVGREGMIGIPVLLRQSKTPYEIVMQVPGDAFAVSADILTQEFEHEGELKDRLLSYTHAQVIYMSQLGVCNHFHTVDQRLCRWLLISSDRVQSDSFHLTPESLSQVLGTGRPGVTIAANKLRQLGLIEYHRDQITIVDRPGMEAISCDCYRITTEVFGHYLGPADGSKMRPLPTISAVPKGSGKSVSLTLSDASSVPVSPANPVASEPINAKVASISRRLKTFLRSLDMTVYQISQITSRSPFGKGTRAHIRDAFYAEIESGQTPDIHQLAALARVTGYRLVDWLAFFGYHVDDILRLQLELHTEHTIVLPSTIYDSLVLMPWIRQFDARVDLDHTQSLVTVIDSINYAPLGALNRLNRRRFLYARVGRRDDMMRPRLVAGTIVRVDPTRTTVEALGGARSMYLVQHVNGLSCCYVELQDDQHMILLPDEASGRVMRCRIGTEATILGAIDLELRQLQTTLPNLSKSPREERHNGHVRLSLMGRKDGAGVYARTTRERIGVSFREAQTMTNRIAAYFDDKRYKIALGSLSDAETYDELPRHISKIFSMCIAYCMDLWQYLRAGGVPVDELNGPAIPRQFLNDNEATLDSAVSMPMVLGSDQKQATESFIERLGEVPFFLLPSVGSIIRQEQLSLDDVYVWGRREPVLHPLLNGALLLLVNRRQRRVPDARAHLSLAEQPLFLIRGPNRHYQAATCAIDAGTMLVRPHSKFRMSVLAYPARDVVVIGRISAVVRTTSGDL
jgi:CRP-like cAMP-binding protein